MLSSYLRWLYGQQLRPHQIRECQLHYHALWTRDISGKTFHTAQCQSFNDLSNLKLRTDREAHREVSG